MNYYKTHHPPLTTHHSPLTTKLRKNFGRRQPDPSVASYLWTDAHLITGLVRPPNTDAYADGQLDTRSPTTQRHPRYCFRFEAHSYFLHLSFQIFHCHSVFEMQRTHGSTRYVPKKRSASELGPLVYFVQSCTAKIW